MVQPSTPPLDPDLPVVRRKCGFPGASVLSGGCTGGLGSLRLRRRDCYLVCSVLCSPDFCFGLLCRGIWIRFWVSCNLLRISYLKPPPAPPRWLIPETWPVCGGWKRPILFLKVMRARMGVIHTHFVGPLTLGCDSDCGAWKGDGLVIVAVNLLWFSSQ